MKIRYANDNDLEAIVDLWQEMMILHIEYNEIYSMKANAQELYRSYAQSVIQDETKKVFVAEEALVMGYMFCEISELPPVYVENRIGCITEICVNQKERRKGIGRCLIDHGLEWFNEQEVNRVDIVIARDNPISQMFWQKVGFTPYNDTCYLRLCGR